MPIAIWVFLLGGLGCLTRFGLDTLILRATQSGFPTSTFLINLLGSFAIGLSYSIYELMRWQWLSKELLVCLTVGFLGGFTTFSAFSLQTIGMYKEGNVLGSALYFFLSPTLGVFFAWLGLRLGQSF